MQPKVFISYSWSSASHQELVKSWADRLIEEGVDVILDIYDLKEGQDKFSFMESMVVDTSITHVLVICDKKYSEKADSRSAGVGTESQIISKKVYDQVSQTKFIPIVCEYDDTGNPFTPAFISSRVYINFSSFESVNENWEQLVRLLHGKPLHKKPSLGKPPSYITNDDSGPSGPSATKFNSLKQALLQKKAGISLYRDDFLSVCIGFADELRIRESVDRTTLGDRILSDSKKLKEVRDQLVDWVILESQTTDDFELGELISKLIESLMILKSRPKELSTWYDSMFEAHSIFSYETFIYIIAALLKRERFAVLNTVFNSSYLIPPTDRRGLSKFTTFRYLWASAPTLHEVLKPSNGGNFRSPAAELIRIHADRKDLTFQNIQEAELLILLMSFLLPTAGIWHPQTLYYAQFHEEYPFFIRTTQSKGFSKLQIITGGKSVEELKEAVMAHGKHLGSSFITFSENCPFWNELNLDAMNSL